MVDLAPRAAAPAGEGSRLRSKIDAVAPVLRAAGGRLLDAEPAPVVYREYLATMYDTVRASVPLMEAALARAEELAPDDPAAARLAAYLPTHIAEETDHDVWLLEDLAAIHTAPSRTVERPPAAQVAAVVGAQYYWIAHGHPIALLAYMAVLESHAPSVAVIERLIERTGYDRPVFRTMLEHAVLDEGHSEGLFRLVDELPLGTDLVKLLGSSAVHTVLGMADVLDEIVARCVPALDTER